MIDFEALLLDPVYATTGVPAWLSDGAGGHVRVTVLDHRDGMDLVSAKGHQISALAPGISATEAVFVVRHSECPARPIGRTVRIDGEDQSYSVRDAKLKGRPGKGEWVLTLQKA